MKEDKLDSWLKITEINKTDLQIIKILSFTLYEENKVLSLGRIGREIGTAHINLWKRLNLLKDKKIVVIPEVEKGLRKFPFLNKIPIKEVLRFIETYKENNPKKIPTQKTTLLKLKDKNYDVNLILKILDLNNLLGFQVTKQGLKFLKTS